MCAQQRNSAPGSLARRTGRRRDRHRDELARSAARRPRRALAGGRARRGVLYPDRPRTGARNCSRGRLAGPDRGNGSHRAVEAAVEAGRPQDRAGRQVRHACSNMRGVRVAPFDDTMLISYTLDAGVNNEDHGIEGFRNGVSAISRSFSEIAGSGRSSSGSRARRSKRPGIRRRGSRYRVASLARAAAAPRRRGMTTVYETAGAAAG